MLALYKIIKIHLSQADLNSYKHTWMCTIPKFALILYLPKKLNSCLSSKQCDLYHPDTGELNSFKENSNRY